MKKLESKFFENKAYVGKCSLLDEENAELFSSSHLPVMCYAQRVRTLLASVSKEKENATTSEECCLLFRILQEEGSKITQSH